jgi:lysozyme
MTPTTPTPAITTGIVDIHHHDRGYDLEAAKRAGLVALIHKATEGVTFKDPRFLDAIKEARDASLLIGAYHFASGTSDAVAQADEFLERVTRALGTVAVDECLLALDLEGDLDDPKTMKTHEAARFVERVHEVTGRWPVLYAGASKTRERARRSYDDLARLGKCPLWLAQYGSMPRPERIPNVWPDWTLWQYTNGSDGPSDRVKFPRTIEGFERPAQDRSVFRGDVEQLRAWWMTAGRTPA